jgi:hypothetical protein
MGPNHMSYTHMRIFTWSAHAHDAQVRGQFEVIPLPPAMVPSPKLWSAEAPHLYAITIVLRERATSGGGKKKQRAAAAAGTSPPLEVLTFHFGFRTVRVERGAILLNDQPLLIKGVNRHEHDPCIGRPDRTPTERMRASAANAHAQCNAHGSTLCTLSPSRVTSPHVAAQTRATWSRVNRCVRTCSR